MRIGERIAQIRKENNLSQEAFGEVLGVSRQAISKWESDASIPDVEKLILLCRTYRVSIGWILGTEEERREASGELTEAQLKMVNEIVRQYIEALPKQAPDKDPKKKKLFAALACVAVAALFIWCGRLSDSLSRTQVQYNNLQNGIYNLGISLDSQDARLTNRIEEILKAQNSLLADCGYEITGCDLAANTLDISVRLIPRTYTPGMTVDFTAVSGGREFRCEAEEGSGHAFTGTLTCDLSDAITLTAALNAGETTENQVIDIVSGEAGESRLKLRPLNGFSTWDYTKAELQKQQPAETIQFPVSDSPYYYRGFEVTVEAIRLDVYVNGEKVRSIDGVWEDSLFGGSDNSGYRFSFPVDFDLNEGDTLAYHIAFTDNYGRQYGYTSTHEITAGSEKGLVEVQESSWTDDYGDK